MLANPKNNKRLILTAIILSAVFFTVPKIAWSQVIINEIMYDLQVGSDDGHEWIELYNNSSSDIDLTDGKINDGDDDIKHKFNTTTAKTPSRGSLILPAGGFLILAGDASKIASDLSGYQGSIIDTTFSLKNASGQLKIFNKDDSELASISYIKELGAAGNGKTLEWDGAALKESLVDGGTPGEANSVLFSNAGSAAPSDSPAPTLSPKATPTPTAINYQYSQKVFLNEFLAWPEDGAKEWVELINFENSAVNLSGWQIDDDDNSTAPQIVPADTTISANGFLVISFNKSTLNNDGDKVRLLWPDDQVVHSVAFDKATQGQAVAKFDSGWLWTNQPTPGQTNRKSLIAKIESVINSASTIKISPKEENVSAPAKNSFITSAAKTATLAPTVSASPVSYNSSQPNLLATASNLPNKKPNSFLALGGVILLAVLASGSLVYWRRRQQVDSAGADD